MLSERLRKSILKFAMEGKLSNQHSEDKSITTFVKIADLDKVKEDDKYWEIPESWGWIRFADLVNFKIGKTPERANSIFWGNYIPWISIADMRGQPALKKTKEKISEIGLENCFNNEIVLKGTLIMSFKLTVGRVSILDIDALHNEAIISIYPKYKEEIQKKYLFHILPYIANMGDTKDAIKGKTLNSKSISELLIPLPPIEEQVRIIEKLETILPIIEQLEINENDLKLVQDKLPERLRNSIIQHGIQGCLTNKGEKKLNNISINNDSNYELRLPVSWKLVKLEKIVNLIGGYAFKSTQYLKSNLDEGIRVIRISDFSNFELLNKSKVYYKYDENLKRYEINENDILLCMTGGTVGKNFLIKNIDEKMYLNQRVAVLRRFDKSIIDIEYLYFVMQSPYIQSIINDSKNSTNDNISMKQISNFMIPLPSLLEQKNIVNKLKELLVVI